MKKNKAFTLIETMVAIFLFIIVLIFIMSVFSTTQLGLSHSEKRIKAMLVARGILNNLSRLKTDEIASFSGDYLIERVVNKKKAIDEFTYDVEVIGTNKKTIKVTVEWREKHHTRSVVLQTIRSDL